MTVTTDDPFGGCPKCGNNSGYLHIGRQHWFYCDEHHTRWNAGTDVFTNRQFQVDRQSGANEKKLFDYQEVVPVMPEPGGVTAEMFTLGNCSCGHEWFVFPPATYADLRWIRQNAPYDIFEAGASAACSRCGEHVEIPHIEKLDAHRPQSFLLIRPGPGQAST